MRRCIRPFLPAKRRSWADAFAQLCNGALAFPIGRVLLRDAAGFPSLAGLAAPRDAVAAAGGNYVTVRQIRREANSNESFLGPS